MGSSRKTADVQPDMNVTPLVDVVLVLLIIFMVVAPRLEQDVQVNLPGVFNPDPEVESSVDPLKVTIAKAGEYHYNEKKLDLDAVIDELSAAHAEEPTRRLILRGDEGLTYGAVRELFARAQKVGFPGIALMVGQLRDAAHRGAPAHAPAPAEPEAPKADAPAAEG